MEINVTKDMPTVKKLYIRYNQSTVSLPASGIVILNAEMLLPAMVPREKRTPGEVRTYEKLAGFEVDQNESSRIAVVNAIEDRKFAKKSVYPAITESVLDRLKLAESKVPTKNLDMWLKDSYDETYKLSLVFEDLDFKDRMMSRDLPEYSKSLVLAAYRLGCGIGTDDRAFNNMNLNYARKYFFDRWEMRTKFCKDDSQSILQKLDRYKGALHP